MKLKNIADKKSGFTLVELLVVIAIIGLLSTLSIVALNSARVKARDASRTASIKQWQTALELYYSDNGAYPASASSTPGGVLTRKGLIFLGKIPHNPSPYTGTVNCTSGIDFAYTAAANDSASTYQISYCLEGGTANVIGGNHTATPAGIANP